MRCSWKGIVLITLLLLAGSGLYAASPLPQVDTVSPDAYGSLWIEASNQFEVQGKNECTGFAVAYVLRHFGVDVTGRKTYDAIKFKLPSGRVLPRGPVNELRRHGMQVQVYTGTLDTLKARLSLGYPVIVVTGNRLKWMHYSVLVGYDGPSRELHIYDPEMTEDTNGRAPGNRTMTEEQFLRLWNTHLPGFRHVYIVCRPQGK